MKGASNVLSKKLICQSFNKAAEHYDGVAYLQRMIGNSLLMFMTEEYSNATILETGSGTGYLTSLIKTQFAHAQLVGIDFAENMVKKTFSRLSPTANFFSLCADADQLPFLDNTFDLVISNLVLQWCQDLALTFFETYRVLKPGGKIIFSTFGPKTLFELRLSWALVDDHIHVNHFFEESVLKKYLKNNGLELVNIVKQNLQCFYPHVIALMRELKLVGAYNHHQFQMKGMTGKQKLKSMIGIYEAFRKKQLPATYEVFYIIAKKVN